MQKDESAKGTGVVLDFIGIGAPRCGTTWITALLNAHPDICTSAQKELHFFSHDPHYKKGTAFLENQFTHCPSHARKGEWSVDYLYSTEAIQRIYTHNPNVRLIVCFRDPVERAYSHFLLQKESAVISPFYTLSKLLNGDDRYKYIKRGHYAKALAPWLSVFPKEQFHFIIYETFVENPQKHIQELYRFLGVDETFLPENISQTVDYRARKKFHFRLLQHAINAATAWYKRTALRPALAVLKLRSGLRFLSRLNRRTTAEWFEKPKLSTAQYAALARHFSTEAEELHTLTGIKPSLWRASKFASEVSNT
ncbi:hypothetical protein COU17_03380 [Candidatus Kaiserbacteria bacterium CG10_big_fil_rev_8_21_14_0_10_49_17]|uniref:Sulfotransferase domain-containing protein n=1 Tax=Candidatus Kaiserbacteria bacterium CG10_big_fil_rev_8_21_14_0_10_49_17 TaxID=1974609 RepID=A0A2M6WDV6_9BACT|nr:MAG: hypothetical protein COU17_03380 [Candidatus Kaiserbacteria bacterium CG10_big_fil_rev_8_21_14_0_10_49_17]